MNVFTCSLVRAEQNIRIPKNRCSLAVPHSRMRTQVRLSSRLLFLYFLKLQIITSCTHHKRDVKCKRSAGLKHFQIIASLKLSTRFASFVSCLRRWPLNKKRNETKTIRFALGAECSLTVNLCRVTRSLSPSRSLLPPGARPSPPSRNLFTRSI